MKGTEGIDYVILECGHCNGSGKCRCYDCVTHRAKKTINEDTNLDQWEMPEGIKIKIEEIINNEWEVKCTVCEGCGKIVFWREDDEDS